MNTAIEVKNLSVSYSKEEAITDINLKISKGEFVNIIGPNGGGKTTLVKSILGLIKPLRKGEILILNNNGRKPIKNIGYVPQNASLEKDFPITVLQTVQTALLKSGLNPFKKFKKIDTEKCLSLLKLLGMEDLVHRQINQLSGGEFQRLLIARALATEPEILILDEPTANIDPLSAEKIYKILDDLHLSGKTVIIISHDLKFVLESGKRTIFINRNILFDGIPTEEIYKL